MKLFILLLITIFTTSLCLTAQEKGKDTTMPQAVKWKCGQAYKDSTDGRKFKTVKIGDQCWMKNNLNKGRMLGCNTEFTEDLFPTKHCYLNDPQMCKIYGGLYTWDEAMGYAEGSLSRKGICPNGWHIPSDEEWSILTEFINRDTVQATPESHKKNDIGGSAGFHLKSTYGWYDCENGSGKYHFSVKPAGIWLFKTGANGHFDELGKKAYFWSSDETDSGKAWIRLIDYGADFVRRVDVAKRNGRSVRCIKD